RRHLARLTVEELADLMDYRVAVSGAAVALAAERRADADVAALGTLVQRMAALDSFPPYRRLDHHFHIAVASAARSPRLVAAETAASHESLFVAPLLDSLHARGFRPATVAMDMGYDHNRIYAECDERGCAAIVPLRKGQRERNIRIPRATGEWRRLYRRRSAVE